MTQAVTWLLKLQSCFYLELRTRLEASLLIRSVAICNYYVPLLQLLAHMQCQDLQLQQQ